MKEKKKISYTRENLVVDLIKEKANNKSETEKAKNGNMKVARTLN